MPSTKTYIPLRKAQKIANNLLWELAPKSLDEYCKIAGSVRRKELKVGDIEIVCIPRREPERLPGELFATPDVNLVAHHCEVSKHFTRIKGGDKYIQADYQGITCDIFMTNKREWGRMYALRTGPASYSKQLARRWRDMGYKGIDGRLVAIRAGVNDPDGFPSERSFFEFLGLDYRPPEER